MRIAVLPGDGIGKEIVPQGVRLLEHLVTQHDLPLEVDVWPYGADRFLATGETLPPGRMDSLRRGDYRSILVGAFGDPRVPDGRHAREILLALRTELDLYVNFRPAQLLHDRLSVLKGKGTKDLGFVVFRENTEGPYVDVGTVTGKGTPAEVAVNEDHNTFKGVSRIIRAALQYARGSGNKRVCMSDKSNAMSYVGDLWQRCWTSVGAEFPELERRHLYIDTLCAELVRSPEQFDVIVTGNLFGDIVSDLAAGLTGGLGMAPSANLNLESGLGMFGPVHGSAPDIAGQGIANPIGMLRSCALMLDHLGFRHAGAMVEHAVVRAVAGGALTPDAGGTSTTADVTDRVIAELDGHSPAPGPSG